jgi:hypothetical protein
MSVQKVVIHAAPVAEQERKEKEVVRATQSAPRYLCSAVPLPSQVSGRSDRAVRLSLFRRSAQSDSPIRSAHEPKERSGESNSA